MSQNFHRRQLTQAVVLTQALADGVLKVRYGLVAKGSGMIQKQPEHRRLSCGECLKDAPNQPLFWCEDCECTYCECEECFEALLEHLYGNHQFCGSPVSAAAEGYVGQPGAVGLLGIACMLEESGS